MDNASLDLVSSPAMRFAATGEGELTVRLSGDWFMGRGLPSFETFREAVLAMESPNRVLVAVEEPIRWDSGLLTFLRRVERFCRERQIEYETQGLPAGVVKLLALAAAVPKQVDSPHSPRSVPALTQVGLFFMGFMRGEKESLSFLGELILGFLNFFRGKARFRRVDLGLFVQECGPRALPIVSVISVLVGIILAFVGAVQLRMFGAQIYVASLVAIAMTREMGAMMTAIIMAGRTGAAYAAQLGTMQVNEEIDALQTFGISPIDFLVLPRTLALILMMPLLCIYSDFMGILGGGLIGLGMLDLSLVEYFNETKRAVSLVDFNAGLIKSVVFGVLIAFSGCLRGIQCGRSSAAVGLAATSAVVTAIVLIVVADGLFAVVYDALGI